MSYGSIGIICFYILFVTVKEIFKVKRRQKHDGVFVDAFEDRRNDWLARQMKEEGLVRRGAGSSSYHIEDGCDARELKEYHRENCDA